MSDARPESRRHLAVTTHLLLLCWFIVHSPCGATDCHAIDNDMGLNSFLWTVKKDPPSYLFGTIHVPYTQVWSFIPYNMRQAFLRADNVYFELDLTDPYTITALSNCQVLEHDQQLADLVPSSIHHRLERHLENVRELMPQWLTVDESRRDIYAEYLFQAMTGNWRHKRPVWVMLMVASLTEQDVRSRGEPVLDLYLAQEAQRMNKLTGAVEQVKDQCEPLNRLNNTQVVFALNQTLTEKEVLLRRPGTDPQPHNINNLINHYNCGDLDALLFNHDTAQVPNLVSSSLPSADLSLASEIDQYFRQELIFRRNQRMADRIERLLNANPNDSYFFAFGAGHFLGNETVIQKLRSKGLDIQHTAPTDEIYLGENPPRVKKKHLQMLADMDDSQSLPPVLITGNLQYLDPYYSNRHRHRHSQRRNGRREQSRHPTTDSYHLKRPQFNDLWVKLEATSFGPNSYFRKHFKSEESPEDSAPAPQVMSGGATIQTTLVLPIIITLSCLITVLSCRTV